MKDSTDPRSGRPSLLLCGAIVLGLAIVAAIAVYTFETYRGSRGEIVTGDEIAKLLGKRRDDPEVQSAFNRLGDGFEKSGPEQWWKRLHLYFHFGKDDRICTIQVGNRDHPYVGGLPFGLTYEDDASSAARKLGVPPLNSSRRTVSWLVESKNLTVFFVDDKVCNVDHFRLDLQ